ncbi:MAG: hypothetical protein JXA74_00450, partial [Anaerolineae bacterium]|nr:hypothetical protein [Anaerolineae bacterium]
MITHPEVDLDQALEELRHNALGLVAPGLMFLGFLWALGNMMLNGIVTSQDTPGLALVVALGALLIVRRRHPNLACWLLLPTLVCIQGLIVWFHPNAAMLYLGLISVILISSVLGLWQAILGAALLWAVGVGVLLRLAPAFRSQVFVSFALYVLATG